MTNRGQLLERLKDPDIAIEDFEYICDLIDHAEDAYLIEVLHLLTSGVLTATTMREMTQPGSAIPPTPRFFNLAIKSKLEEKTSDSDYQMIMRAAQTSHQRDSSELFKLLTLFIKGFTTGEEFRSILNTHTRRHQSAPKLEDFPDAASEMQSLASPSRTMTTMQGPSCNNPPTQASSEQAKATADGSVSATTSTSSSRSPALTSSDQLKVQAPASRTQKHHDLEPLKLWSFNRPSEPKPNYGPALLTPDSARANTFGAAHQNAMVAELNKSSGRTLEMAPTVPAMVGSWYENDDKGTLPPPARGSLQQTPRSLSGTLNTLSKNPRHGFKGTDPLKSASLPLPSLSLLTVTLHKELSSRLKLLGVEETDHHFTLPQLFYQHAKCALTIVASSDDDKAVQSIILDTALKANDKFVAASPPGQDQFRRTARSFNWKGSLIDLDTARPPSIAFAPSVLILVENNSSGIAGAETREALKDILAQTSLPISVGAFFKGCHKIDTDDAGLYPAIDIGILSAAKCSSLVHHKHLDLGGLKLVVWMNAKQILGLRLDETNGQRHLEQIRRDVQRVFAATSSVIGGVRHVFTMPTTAALAIKAVVEGLQQQGEIAGILEVGLAVEPSTNRRPSTQATAPSSGVPLKRRAPIDAETPDPRRRKIFQGEPKQGELFPGSNAHLMQAASPSGPRSGTSAFESASIAATTRAVPGNHSAADPRLKARSSNGFKYVVEIDLKQASGEAILGDVSESKILPIVAGAAKKNGYVQGVYGLDDSAQTSVAAPGKVDAGSPSARTPAIAVPTAETGSPWFAQTSSAQKVKPVQSAVVAGTGANDSTTARAAAGPPSAQSRALGRSATAGDNPEPVLKAKLGLTADHETPKSTAPARAMAQTPTLAHPTSRPIPQATPQSTPMQAHPTAANAQLGHFTLDTIDHARICPKKLIHDRCKDSCKLLAVCIDFDGCDGRCDKVHEAPCPRFLIHVCKGERNDRCLYSHDPRWKEIWKREGQHEKELARQR